MFLCLILLSLHEAKASMYNMECYDWSGFYVGINGGYGWGRANYAFTPGANGSGPVDEFTPGGLFADYDTGGSFRHNLRGGILGGHLGYNIQFCSFLFGLEGAFEGSWMKGRSVDPLAPLVLPTATYRTQMDWLATCTPRLGYVYNSWLLYAKGGLAAARFSSKLTSTTSFIDVEDVVPGFRQTHDHIGWTVGGGIEWSLCGSWILGLEYDYYKLPSRTYGGIVDPDTSWPLEYTIQPTFNTVLARLSYKFGHSRY